MPANTETVQMLRALLGLRLDMEKLRQFTQAFADKGYSQIRLYDLIDITIRKVGITEHSISRLNEVAVLHPEMKKAELARYLKVSRQTIYNWIEEGLLILTPDGTRIRTAETALLWQLLLHLIGHD